MMKGYRIWLDRISPSHGRSSFCQKQRRFSMKQTLASCRGKLFPGVIMAVVLIAMVGCSSASTPTPTADSELQHLHQSRVQLHLPRRPPNLHPPCHRLPPLHHLRLQLQPLHQAQPISISLTDRQTFTHHVIVSHPYTICDRNRGDRSYRTEFIL